MERVTVKRIRHLIATLATVVLVPGAAPAALADSDPAPGPERAAVRAEPSAAERQRRVEHAYVIEQYRAAARQERR